MPFLRHFAMGIVLAPLARPAVRATLRAGMTLPSMLLDAWKDVRTEADTIRADAKAGDPAAVSVVQAVEHLRSELEALRDELRAGRQGAAGAAAGDAAAATAAPRVRGSRSGD